VKRQTICAVFAMLAFAAPATVFAQGIEPGALPPHEILTILRSTGLDPLGQPVRRGPHYVMRAVDNTDREVRVIIRARSGDIVSVTPVATPMPPRGGITVGRYERMPPGYVLPRGGYGAGAPIVDEDDGPAFYNPNTPRPPGAVPGAPPRSSTAARPQPPRGGAMAADDDDVSPRSGPNVVTADPDRSGALPPPPERFPQRVAPPAPPKPKPVAREPVTRAAAAPPKQAPLPKPKPAITADAPPPLAPPAPAAAADETPH
jgi:hypothetical protein